MIKNDGHFFPCKIYLTANYGRFYPAKVFQQPQATAAMDLGQIKNYMYLCGIFERYKWLGNFIVIKKREFIFPDLYFAVDTRVLRYSIIIAHAGLVKYSINHFAAIATKIFVICMNRGSATVFPTVVTLNNSSIVFWRHKFYFKK